MDNPIRFAKLPTTIQEITTSDNSAMPAAGQATIQSGIASAKDSLETWQENPFSAVGTQNITTSANPFEGLLQESRVEISSYLKGEDGTASPETAEPFRAMQGYLMLTQAEVHADSKTQGMFKEISMMGKESKITLDNDKIDQQMKEAGQKASAAMEQATLGLVMGTISGAFSIAGAAAELKDIASQEKGILFQSNPDPKIESRYQHFTSLLDDLGKVENPFESSSQSKRLSQAANLEEIQTKKLENAASDADDVAKSSAGHRDRMRDAILDLLRKLQETNPKI